jgi:hypothetical protein
MALIPWLLTVGFRLIKVQYGGAAAKSACGRASIDVNLLAEDR